MKVFKVKGAIFDIDGVIIDTSYIHYKSWKKLFKEYGVKFNYRKFKKTIDGLPRYEGIKKILPHLSEKELLEAGERKQKYFEEYLKKEKIKVFKSTVKFIKKLKNKNIKVAMASSSKNAKPILKNLNLYFLFDADAEGAYIKRGKPHPDIFLKAAKKLKLKPEECIVFEDSQMGINAAKKAKMKCVGINRDGKHKLKNADIIIKNIQDIKIEKL